MLRLAGARCNLVHSTHKLPNALPLDHNHLGLHVEVPDLKAAQKAQQITDSNSRTRPAAGMGTTEGAGSEKATHLGFAHKLKLVSC